MALGSYLLQRGLKGTWYVRLAVPRGLQLSMGKRERIKSLGTSDRVLAERKALPIIAQWRAEEGLAVAGDQTMLAQSFDGHRAAKGPGRVPSDSELETAAVEVGYDMVTEYEDRRRKALQGENEDRFRRYVRRSAINLDTHIKLSVTGDNAMVRGFADEIIAHNQYDLPVGSAGYIKLCEYLNLARLAAIRTANERAQGFLEAETDSPLVRRVREREKAKAKSGESILELCDKWHAQQLSMGEKRKDGTVQDRKIIERFAEFIGIDRAIDSISRLEVAEYRDTLQKLPPKWMSKRELRDLDMRTAAMKARELNFPNMSYTNVNKALSTISPLFKWLRSHPRWAHLENPVDGLFYQKVKGKKPRPPFSTATLNKILGSPLFTGFRSDGDEHISGDKYADDWRKWVPLLAMFMGARLGEVAQLRIGDVRIERGEWFVHIVEDEQAGLTTKSRKARAMALHPLLLKMGFLEFRERRREQAKDDNARLFPELKKNSRGQISGYVSRWWRDYLKAIGVKNGSDGQGAHSFRHTLADRLRSEAELLDNEVAVVLGHSSATTTAGYGELAQGTVNMLKGWMDAVRFDGVVFDHLFVSDAARGPTSNT